MENDREAASCPLPSSLSLPPSLSLSLSLSPPSTNLCSENHPVKHGADGHGEYDPSHAEAKGNEPLHDEARTDTLLLILVLRPGADGTDERLRLHTAAVELRVLSRLAAGGGLASQHPEERRRLLALLDCKARAVGRIRADRAVHRKGGQDRVHLAIVAIDEEERHVSVCSCLLPCPAAAATLFSGHDEPTLQFLHLPVAEHAKPVVGWNPSFAFAAAAAFCCTLVRENVGERGRS